ncbi:hypothetical protein ACLOJK_002391 [Asimina triloba]
MPNRRYGFQARNLNDDTIAQMWIVARQPAENILTNVSDAMANAKADEILDQRQTYLEGGPSANIQEDETHPPQY